MADNRTTLTITNPTGGTREVNVIAGSEREKRLLSQGAVSSKGMSGLEPFNYTPQSITPIPVSTLTSQDRPIEVTSQQPVSLNSTIDTYQPSNYTKTLQNTQNDLSQTESTSFEKYLKAQLEAPTKAELTNKEYTNAGISDLESQLSELDTQLLSEKENLRKLTEKLQTGVGIATSDQRNASVAEAERVSLRKQADISVQQYALQGRYDSAKAAADRAVDALYEQGQQKLDILGAIYSRNKELFDKAEQRAFESAQADRQAQLDQEKEDRNLIYQTGLTVGQNGGSQELMQQIFNAKSPEEAAKLASGYLVNPVDRELKNLQLETAKLEYNQAQTAQEALSDPKWGTIINQTASLVGTERGKKIRIDLAGYIANGNYSAAWNEVTNAVEEKLTGENATKFGNQVTDYNAMVGLRDAIQEYSDAGGNMGLLVGKAEDISNRLAGVTSNPKLTELATQLNREFQTYRTNATGAAFSPEESREYQKVNPRTTASLDLNLAVIDGALNQLQNRIISTTEARISGSGDLWKLSHGQVTSEYLDSVDTVLQSQSNPIQDYINSLNLK